MRYEIDWKNKIVDFYIEDESGREHHSGIYFDEVKELCIELMEKLNKAELEKVS